MSDGNFAPIADGAQSHAVDRRTLLVGAAGALAAAALSAPARAAGSATSVPAESAPRLDPALARHSSRRCGTPSAIRARTPPERFCT